MQAWQSPDNDMLDLIEEAFLSDQVDGEQMELASYCVESPFSSHQIVPHHSERPYKDSTSFSMKINTRITKYSFITAPVVLLQI